MCLNRAGGRSLESSRFAIDPKTLCSANGRPIHSCLTIDLHAAWDAVLDSPGGRDRGFIDDHLWGISVPPSVCCQSLMEALCFQVVCVRPSEIL